VVTAKIPSFSSGAAESPKGGQNHPSSGQILEGEKKTDSFALLLPSEQKHYRKH